MTTSGTFAITTTSTSVKLPPSRTGQLLFTVTNTSGRQLTVRGIVVTPQGPTQKTWFVIDGQPERASAPNTSLDYTVNVLVPPEAPAGPVIVRFDAIGVENPDAYASQGPTVVIEVPPAAVTKKPFPWWIVAIAAAILLIAGGTGFAWYAIHNHLFGPNPTPTSTPVNPLDTYVGSWTLRPGQSTPFTSIQITRQGDNFTGTFNCRATGCPVVSQNGTYSPGRGQITFDFNFTGEFGIRINYTASVSVLSSGQLQLFYTVNGVVNGPQQGPFYYVKFTGLPQIAQNPVAKRSW